MRPHATKVLTPKSGTIAHRPTEYLFWDGRLRNGRNGHHQLGSSSYLYGKLGNDVTFQTRVGFVHWHRYSSSLGGIREWDTRPAEWDAP